MTDEGSGDRPPYYQDDTVTVHAGDCLDIMATMPDASVDSVVCDPPYSIAFMGRKWDAHDSPKQFETWCETWATECLRVLKPGGHLVAFGGPRTYHRLTAGIEDAGFEIRDSIGYGQGHTMAWMYGSGFPKSLDVAKAIDKQRDDRDDVLAVTGFLADHADARGITRADVDGHMGTSDMGGWWLSRLRHRCALPTWDQWLRLKMLMQLPSDMDAEVWRLNGRKGTPGDAWQDADVVGIDRRFNEPSGVVNVGQGDRSPVDRLLKAPNSAAAERWRGFGTALKPAWEPIVLARKPLDGTVARNVLAHGVGALNIGGCRIEGRDRTEYGLANAKRSRVATYGEPTESADFDASKGRWPPNVVLDEAAASELDQQSGTRASTPSKLPRGRRPRGMGETGERGGDPSPNGPTYADEGGASRFFPVFRYEAKAGSKERPEVDGVKHPTVKPLNVIRWLSRLVTPPGGLVLDPFAGSGTTAEACVLEGFRCIAIEREPTYLPLIVARLSKSMEIGFDFEASAG